ncbi:mitotic-spindle organizing protein 2A [Trichonephila clavipes]|nr:mitotic-spindle organizing protein 2A [Trichonephila clavipes]
MSSRMEHLTISFFAVLEERGQRNLLEWCMRENLISSRYECPKCGKNMVMRERKGTIDGYEWRCRTKGGENPHDVCKSIRKGTWFSKSHLSVCDILILTRHFFGKSMNEFAVKDVRVNKNTVVDWYMFCRRGHSLDCYRDLKTSIQHYVHRVLRETWDQKILYKLHSIHHSTSHWAALPVQRHDVRLIRLPIGHSLFTHSHLLLGENAPECPSCKVAYSIYHILIDCPVFNHHRITFFHASVFTLSDLVGESPHQNLFAFLFKIGFLHMI